MNCSVVVLVSLIPIFQGLGIGNLDMYVSFFPLTTLRVIYLCSTVVLFDKLRGNDQGNFAISPVKFDNFDIIKFYCL